MYVCMCACVYVCLGDAFVSISTRMCRLMRAMFYFAILSSLIIFHATIAVFIEDNKHQT